MSKRFLDTVTVCLPPGCKEDLKFLASLSRLSVSGYLRRLIILQLRAPGVKQQLAQKQSVSERGCVQDPDAHEP